MKEIPKTVDSNGELVFPSLHDGSFDGIVKIKDGLTNVFLTDLKGVNYLMELFNVKYLRIIDFREKNIILSIGISSLDVNNYLLDSTLNELFDLLQGDSKIKFIEKIKLSIKSGQLMLIDISPSYGGSLIAVCENMKIYKNE